MQVPLGSTVALLVAMATKHLVADFLLQTGAIARGKAARTGWLAPLSLHAGLHALITLGIVLAVVPSLWWLAAAEFAVHAGIDRGKALVGQAVTLDPSRDGFWWLLGLDQFLHQLTNIGIVAVMVARAA